MKIIITERQNKILMENIPVALRRRFNYDDLKGHLENLQDAGRRAMELQGAVQSFV